MADDEANVSNSTCLKLETLVTLMTIITTAFGQKVLDRQTADRRVRLGFVEFPCRGL